MEMNSSNASDEEIRMVKKSTRGDGRREEGGERKNLPFLTKYESDNFILIIP